MSTISETVIEIIKEHLGVPAATITPETTIYELTVEEGMDSLDSVELLMTFEEEFDIDFPDSDGEKLKTVGDAIAYIEKAKRAAA